MSARLLVVVGARPNFVKVAPILQALHETPSKWSCCTPVSTTTTPSANRSWRCSAFPSPDFRLGVGSASHARQTAAVMVGW